MLQTTKKRRRKRGRKKPWLVVVKHGHLRKRIFIQFLSGDQFFYSPRSGNWTHIPVLSVAITDRSLQPTGEYAKIQERVFNSDLELRRDLSPKLSHILITRRDKIQS